MRNTQKSRVKRPTVHSNRKRRKRRQYIYKPDYAGIRQIAIAKRVVGGLLVLLLAAAIAALLVLWVIPSVLRTLESPPEESKVLEQTESAAEEQIAEIDAKTGLPVYQDGFNLFVINKNHPVDETFTVITEEVSGVKVDQRIVPALTMLLEEAEAAGVQLELDSGYVSYDEQKQLYQKQIDALVAAGSTKVMAREDAKSTAPAPGESDFQSGMCVRLKADAKTFHKTKACSWLQTNMGKYGFVFRYPEGKEKYTGCTASDLVLRYVGIENAAMMRQLSMCLEEYIDYMEE